MKVQVDEAGHHGAAGQIQPHGAVRHGPFSPWSHALDAIVADGHAHIVLRGLSGAIDDARVIQHQDSRRLAANGQRIEVHRDDEEKQRENGAHALAHQPRPPRR